MLQSEGMTSKEHSYSIKSKVCHDTHHTNNETHVCPGSSIHNYCNFKFNYHLMMKDLMYPFIVLIGVTLDTQD